MSIYFKNSLINHKNNIHYLSCFSDILSENFGNDPSYAYVGFKDLINNNNFKKYLVSITNDIFFEKLSNLINKNVIIYNNNILKYQINISIIQNFVSQNYLNNNVTPENFNSTVIDPKINNIKDSINDIYNNFCTENNLKLFKSNNWFLLPVSTLTHAMMFCFKYIDDNNIEFIFINTGDGLQYHKSKKHTAKDTDLLLRKCLLKFNINLDKFKQLLYLSVLSKNHIDDIRNFYILLQKIISDTNDNELSLNDLDISKDNDYYYLLEQLGGSCTYLSFVYSIMILICEERLNKNLIYKIEKVLKFLSLEIILNLPDFDSFYKGNVNYLPYPFNIFADNLKHIYGNMPKDFEVEKFNEIKGKCNIIEKKIKEEYNEYSKLEITGIEFKSSKSPLVPPIMTIKIDKQTIMFNEIKDMIEKINVSDNSNITDEYKEDAFASFVFVINLLYIYLLNYGNDDFKMMSFFEYTRYLILNLDLDKLFEILPELNDYKLNIDFDKYDDLVKNFDKNLIKFFNTRGNADKHNIKNLEINNFYYAENGFFDKNEIKCQISAVYNVLFLLLFLLSNCSIIKQTKQNKKEKMFSNINYVQKYFSLLSMLLTKKIFNLKNEGTDHDTENCIYELFKKSDIISEEDLNVVKKIEIYYNKYTIFKSTKKDNNIEFKLMDKIKEIAINIGKDFDTKGILKNLHDVRQSKRNFFDDIRIDQEIYLNNKKYKINLSQIIFKEKILDNIKYNSSEYDIFNIYKRNECLNPKYYGSEFNPFIHHHSGFLGNIEDNIYKSELNDLFSIVKNRKEKEGLIENFNKIRMLFISIHSFIFSLFLNTFHDMNENNLLLKILNMNFILPPLADFEDKENINIDIDEILPNDYKFTVSLKNNTHIENNNIFDEINYLSLNLSECLNNNYLEDTFSIYEYSYFLKTKKVQEKKITELNGFSNKYEYESKDLINNPERIKEQIIIILEYIKQKSNLLSVENTGLSKLMICCLYFYDLYGSDDKIINFCTEIRNNIKEIVNIIEDKKLGNVEFIILLLIIDIKIGNLRPDENNILSIKYITFSENYEYIYNILKHFNNEIRFFKLLTERIEFNEKESIYYKLLEKIGVEKSKKTGGFVFYLNDNKEIQFENNKLKSELFQTKDDFINYTLNIDKSKIKLEYKKNNVSNYKSNCNIDINYDNEQLINFQANVKFTKNNTNNIDYEPRYLKNFFMFIYENKYYYTPAIPDNFIKKNWFFYFEDFTKKEKTYKSELIETNKFDFEIEISETGFIEGNIYNIIGKKNNKKIYEYQNLYDLFKNNNNTPYNLKKLILKLLTFEEFTEITVFKKVSGNILNNDFDIYLSNKNVKFSCLNNEIFYENNYKVIFDINTTNRYLYKQVKDIDVMFLLESDSLYYLLVFDNNLNLKKPDLIGKYLNSENHLKLDKLDKPKFIKIHNSGLWIEETNSDTIRFLVNIYLFYEKLDLLVNNKFLFKLSIDNDYIFRNIKGKITSGILEDFIFIYDYYNIDENKFVNKYLRTNETREYYKNLNKKISYDIEGKNIFNTKYLVYNISDENDYFPLYVIFVNSIEYYSPNFFDKITKNNEEIKYIFFDEIISQEYSDEELNILINSKYDTALIKYRNENKPITLDIKNSINFTHNINELVGKLTNFKCKEIIDETQVVINKINEKQNNNYKEKMNKFRENKTKFNVFDKNKLQDVKDEIEKLIDILRKNINNYINKYENTLLNLLINTNEESIRYIISNIVYNVLREIKLFMRNMNEDYLNEEFYDSCRSILNIIKNLSNENKEKIELLYEFSFGYFIKSEQKKLIDTLFNELEGNSNTHIHQLIMGGGKSSVVAPLLSAKLYLFNTTDPYTIINILPDSLINDSLIIFKKYLLPIINNLKIGSKYESDNNIKIITSTEIKKEIINAYLNDAIKLDRLKKNKYIIDEVDELSDSLKSELNIPLEGDMDSQSEPLIDEFLFEFINAFLENKEINENCNHPEKSHKFLKESTQEVKKKLIVLMKPILIKKFWKIFKLNFTENEIQNIIDGNIQEMHTKIKNDFVIYRDLYHIINRLIPVCLRKQNRKDFGLIKIKTDSDFKNLENIKEEDKKYFLAIPFRGQEIPSETSEFQDPQTIKIYTIMSFLDPTQIPSEKHLEIYFNLLKFNHNTNYIESINYSRYKYKFDNIINASNIKGKYLENFKGLEDYTNEEKNILLKNYEFKKDYIVNYVFPTVLKIKKKMKNISFQDVLNPLTGPHKVGFTGTPFVYVPETKLKTKHIDNEIKENDIDLGGIYCAINNIYSNNKTEKLEFKLNQTNEILNYAIENSYNTLIDVGSYFIGYDAYSLALKIQSKITNASKIKSIIYITSEGIKKGFYVTEPTKIYNLSEITSPLDERFYIFLQSQITGHDVKMSPTAKGLITINKNTRFRDIAQGIFRMRKLNYGQHIDYISDNFPDNLLETFLDNENKYQKSSEKLSKLQNLKTLYRYEFALITDKQNIYNEEIKTGILTFDQLLEKIKDNHYKNIFNNLKEVINTNETKYIKLISLFISNTETFKYLNENSLEDLEQTVEITIEKEQQKEQQKEMTQEKQKEQIKEQEQDIIVDQSYIYENNKKINYIKIEDLFKTNINDLNYNLYSEYAKNEIDKRQIFKNYKIIAFEEKEKIYVKIIKSFEYTRLGEINIDRNYVIYDFDGREEKINKDKSFISKYDLLPYILKTLKLIFGVNIKKIKNIYILIGSIIKIFDSDDNKYAQLDKIKFDLNNYFFWNPRAEYKNYINLLSLIWTHDTNCKQIKNYNCLKNGCRIIRSMFDEISEFEENDDYDKIFESNQLLKIIFNNLGIKEYIKQNSKLKENRILYKIIIDFIKKEIN